MKIRYKETLDGCCIQRCYGLDGIVEIPEEIDGKKVTELDSYVFSETVRGRSAPPAEYMGEPELSGTDIEELVLPEHVKKVGAYAFYNCCRLKALSFRSTVRDWGAGVFTGCGGIERLDIRMVSGEKSCFQEILAELRQTLEVNYRDSEGKLLARLIFPEFFEESVENTPARIIMREMHGCGHMYRYCFDNSGFVFREYDALFPHVQVQEKPELVTRLALYRLYWPWGLGEQAEEAYWAYVRTYAGESAAGLITRGETELLRWMAYAEQLNHTALENMIKSAGGLGDAEALALLMDAKHSRFGGAGKGERRRTFEL